MLKRKDQTPLRYVASEISILTQQKLTSTDFARLGKMLKSYSLLDIYTALDTLENLIVNDKVSLTEPVGLFQTILASIKASVLGQGTLEDLLKANVHTL